MEEFGKILRNAREQKGYSPEDVASATKIRLPYIQMMEEGNFAELPNVYGKSFLKTYASFLGVPKEDYIDVIENLNKEDVSYQENIKLAEPPSSEKGRRKKRVIPNYRMLFKNAYKGRLSNVNLMHVIIYTIVGAALLLVLYYTFVAESDTEATATNDITLANDTNMIEPGSSGLFSYFEEKSDSLLLAAKAKDTSWIKIDIDGVRAEEILMLPNMERQWSASEYFLITQGNVGAVQFTRNGNLLEPFGNKGSVVKNVKVTADQIIYDEAIRRDSIRGTSRASRKQPREIKTISSSPIVTETSLNR